MSALVQREIPRNELSAKWLGACGLNPQHIYDSSARLQMLSQHTGQMLVLEGSSTRRLQTGMERQYGKYTYRVEMPCNGLILEIIQRYPETFGPDGIRSNPQTIVVYEDQDDDRKTIGCVELTDYCSNHQYFGFRYKEQAGYSQLRQGSYIRKGTVFLDSPSVTPEGDYKYGVQANVAFMTHPATAEDGIAVSDSFLERLGFRTFEHRVVEYGKKTYALNLYGDENRHKPFPDIGDEIRPDGLLMALRDYDPPELAIVEQNIHSLREVDFTFDKRIYANGAGGRVIDVRIHHDLADSNCAEVHMDAQPKKYDAARRRFYKRLMNLYFDLVRKRGKDLVLTPRFHQLIVQAQSVESEGKKDRVTKLYRKAPLDTYRVEFVIEYLNIPNRGNKVTDLHGGKGVLCQVIKAEHMPVDSEGNPADFIMDPNSTINRANPGRMYEQYYNAAARDVHKRLCAMLEIAPFTSEVKAFNHISKLPPAQVEAAWQYLQKFYSIIAPEMHHWFETGQISATIPEYLAEVVKLDVGLFTPPDSQAVAKTVVRTLENDPLYRPVYGPVSYVGNSGQRVTTIHPVRIGEVYIVLLEKTGDDWSSVSSGKLQLFGVLGQLVKSDKNANPARQQAVRVQGEGEIRIMISNCGERAAVEIQDRNNNPVAHKAMADGILSAETPGNIDVLVDRNLIPYGGSKPLQMFKHVLQVSGLEFAYTPHDPNKPKISAL